MNFYETSSNSMFIHYDNAATNVKAFLIGTIYCSFQKVYIDKN